MIAIPYKIINDFDKYIHYIVTNNIVFEINRMDKPVIYTNIFKYDSCYDLYLNISKLCKNNNEAPEKIMPILENNNYYLDIYDIFMMDVNNNILSIPYNDKITIQEFIHSNKTFFEPIYPKPIRSIFKIYIIDSDFLYRK